MSEFLSNLIERHLESPNVVAPRTLSRFETGGVGLSKPLPIDGSASEEAGVEKQDSTIRAPETDPVVPPLNRIESPRIDPEVILPVAPVAPVGPKGDYLERRDDLVRASVTHSLSADGNPPETEHHYGTPLIQHQDLQTVKPNTAEQSNQKGEYAPHPVFHRHLTVETESQSTPPGDMHGPRSNRDPTAETRARTSELGFSIDGELDKRISAMLARLKDHQKSRPAEQTETKVLDRSIGAEPDTSVATEKDRAAQPPFAAPLLSGSESLSSSVADQEQHATGSDYQDVSPDGLLAPPTWLAEMQTEFNRRWNELNRNSEPEPVVNVTIGRVEVRAVQAETPQKSIRKRKPSGVMSLDDYLNQRERRS
jgi:hypothetical protein